MEIKGHKREIRGGQSHWGIAWLLFNVLSLGEIGRIFLASDTNEIRIILTNLIYPRLADVVGKIGQPFSCINNKIEKPIQYNSIKCTAIQITIQYNTIQWKAVGTTIFHDEHGHIYKLANNNKMDEAIMPLFASFCSYASKEIIAW